MQRAGKCSLSSFTFGPSAPMSNCVVAVGNLPTRPNALWQQFHGLIACDSPMRTLVNRTGTYRAPRRERIFVVKVQRLTNVWCFVARIWYSPSWSVGNIASSLLVPMFLRLRLQQVRACPGPVRRGRGPGTGHCRR